MYNCAIIHPRNTTVKCLENKTCPLVFFRLIKSFRLCRLLNTAKSTLRYGIRDVPFMWLEFSNNKNIPSRRDQSQLSDSIELQCGVLQGLYLDQ